MTERKGIKKNYGEAIKLNNTYMFVVTYQYPAPLPCSSGVNTGCSEIVDAGASLGGTGRFCDYLVLCAGITVTIFYNRFENAA